MAAPAPIATIPRVGTAAAKDADLSAREKLYASGNRKRQNRAKAAPDHRPRSR